MKTLIKKQLRLLIIISFLSEVIVAQPQPNLVPNPSFEGKDCCPQGPTDPNDYPVITCLQDWRLPREQNIGDCIGSGQCVGSPDYHNTCDYSIHTPRTGDGYVGFVHGTGQSKDYEYTCVKLTSKLIKDHYYYVEFYIGGGPGDKVGAYFSDDIPRQHRENRIKKNLTITIDPQIENPEGRVLVDPNSLIWVKVSGYFIPDVNDLEWLTIGNFTNEREDGFFYLDDAKVIDLGLKCNCVQSRYIENTTYDYPEPVIRANDFIYAGDIADPSSPYDGPVHLRYGALVVYKATNYVQLGSGVSIDQGAEFVAVNESCNLGAGPITINSMPNVFTPDGNGINDVYCVNQSGANQFEVFIYAGHYGALVYQGVGEIGSNSNLVCVWNGHCNTGATCTGQVVSDGWYTCVIKLHNCEGDKEDARFFFVNGNGRYINPDLLQPQTTIPSVLKLHPNPNDGNFTLEVEDDTKGSDFEVLDILGKTIYKGHVSDLTTKIDLSNVENGIYYMLLKSPTGMISKKIVKQ